MSAVDYQLQGQNGGVVVTSASGTVTGQFRWISVITTAVIAGISSNLTGEASLVGLSLAPGIGIGGETASFSLTSGVVIAYY